MPDLNVVSYGRRNLNVEAARVHEANAKWWIDINTGEPLNRNVGELMMLVISELSEALEGDRKDLMDDKLPHRKMFEVELADAVIRLLDIAGGFQLDINEVEAQFVGIPIFTYNTAENLLMITDKCVAAHKGGLAFYVGKALWMIEHLASLKFCDLWAAYEEKMAYNAVRADHKVENRLKEGGKKY
jgi:hypothetical protein